MLNTEENYDKKFNLMLQLMIVYNSYCLNYRFLAPELLHSFKEVDPANNGDITTLLHLEISRRFYFHVKISNYLSSVQNVIDITRNTINKLNCEKISTTYQDLTSEIDNQIHFVKDLRNIYTHNKLLPVHYKKITIFSGKAEEKYQLELSRDFVLNQNIKKSSKNYLESSEDDDINLHDLFKAHYEFTINLYYKIKTAFLEIYVTNTSLPLHKGLCKQDGLNESFDLLL